MNLKIKRIFLLLWIFCIPVQILFSQNHISRNNYKGDWEAPASWTPEWLVPQSDIKNTDVFIYGYITRNGSLSLSGGSSNLIIYDTLVIKGNFSIEHENHLIVRDNGILIIQGDLYIDDDADITANGYIIVTGNILMNHHIPNGSFISNDNPVKVFFGGSISSEIPVNDWQYPVFNCSVYIQYPNSGCGYGNLIDLANDPIFNFFQSTIILVELTASPGTLCSGADVHLYAEASGGSGSYTYSWTSIPAGFTSSVADPVSNPEVNTTYSVSVFDGIATIISSISVTVNAIPETPAITAGGPITFCTGGSVNLTTNAGASYLWSDGATTASIYVVTSGSYTVIISNIYGCHSPESSPTVVTANALPAVPSITTDGPVTFCTDGNVTLTSSAGESFLWSNEATAQSIKIYTSENFNVKVTNESGCQSAASATVSVTVNEIPVAAAGPEQELNYVFETLMAAELSLTDTGEWSLVSGSGNIADIHSPQTIITELSIGENIFKWKVNNGFCEASEEIKITVLDLIVPSVITPDGDGKNDFFRISLINGQVKLIIFNRWGNQEYANQNYSNDWDGRNSKGKELPADTYFYILSFENGEIRKGSVLIKR